jgi:hypothetical protein
MGIGGPPLRSLAPDAVDDDTRQRESHPGHDRQMRGMRTRSVAGVLVLRCRDGSGQKRRDGGQAKHQQADPGEARKATDLPSNPSQRF